MMTARQEPWRRRLYLPAYSVAQAARLARTPPQTVSYWLSGYRTKVGPALPGHEPRAALNFLQLVEIAMVASFRALGISLQRLRAAHEYLAARFQAEYPFAVFKLQTEGLHVLLEYSAIAHDPDIGKVIVADASGQMAWKPLIGERFYQFDYEDSGLVIRWHPFGRQSLLLVDPKVSFGAPTVEGVATWAIKGRVLAGETVEEITDDFEISERAVKEALHFEEVSLAA